MSGEGSGADRGDEKGSSKDRSGRDRAIDRRRRFVAMFLMWLLVSAVPVLGEDAPSEVDVTVVPSDAVDPTAAFVDAPARFTENLGQWDDEVRFMIPTAFGRALLCRNGVTYNVAVGEDTWYRVDVSFVGSTGAEPVGVGDSGFPTSYFIGNDPARWATDVRSYEEVVYHDVWPDVDIRYHLEGASLKYDVVLGVSASPSTVVFEVDGCEGLEVSDDSLEIVLPGGQSLNDGELLAWYEDGDGVDVRFLRMGTNRYGFSVEKQPGRRMVIDPVVMHASTFIGSHYDDLVDDVVIDDEGNVYVVGATFAKDFPTPSGYHYGASSYWDIVVTKLSHNLSKVIWSTFIGGTNYDFASGIDLDEEGNIYIAGWTWSWDLPITKGCYQPVMNNGFGTNMDIFVAKLKYDGSVLEYLTYVGGSGPEQAHDLKVFNGMAYVAGATDSVDFPAVNGPHEAVFTDSLFFMLNQNGSEMLDSEIWAGRESEHAYALDVDENGDIVVGGYTSSTAFPITPGTLNPFKTGMVMGFIARYSPSKDETYFTALFGANYELIEAIALDDDHNIYIGGFAQSGVLPFPLTPDAFDREFNGRTEAFLAKINPQGTRILFSTLLGGNGHDRIQDIEIDSEGRIAVVGYVESGTNFTVTEDCCDPDWAGEREGFVLILEGDSYEMCYSTFLGGREQDEAIAVRVDDRDNLVVVGSTYSGDFPVNDDGLQTQVKGGSDMFVSIIGELTPPTAPRNLTATNREDHISLEWKPPLRDGNHSIREYLVYRGLMEDALEPYAVLGDVTEMEDYDVEHGTVYYYVVIATNWKGMSPPSNVAFARLLTAPDPPLNLTCSLNFDSVNLSWDPPAFTGGLSLREYRLYRRAEGGAMTLIKVIDPDAMSFEDAEVDDGTLYTYMLTTVTEFGKSRTSPSVAVRTHGPPTPPLGVRHAYGELFIRLEWDVPVDDLGLPVADYVVYRGEGEGPLSPIGATGSPSRAFVDTGVEVGVVYRYAVAAINAKGESLLSDEHEAMARVRPGPPIGVIASAEESAVRVTWSPPAFDGASPVLGYWVYHAVAAGTWVNVGGIFIEGREGVPLVFLHDASYDGTAREYYMTAFNAEGESDPSDVASTRVIEVPGAPVGLKLTRGDGELALSWDPPPFDGGMSVLSYTVYRRTGADDGYQALVTLPYDIGHFVDDTTENGVVCAYRVTACNIVGEGPPSLSVSGSSAGPPLPPHLLASESHNCSGRITWEPPAATGGLPLGGYRVYVIKGGVQFQLLAELGPDASEFVIADLVNGDVYLYGLRAFNDVGESLLSEFAEIRPVGPPAAPQGLVALWVEDHVHVAWAAPLEDGGKPVRGYRVHRDDWPADDWRSLSALDVLFRDHDVLPGGSYNYSVQAFNDIGVGPIVRVNIVVPQEPAVTPEATTYDIWPLLLIIAGLTVVIVAISIVRLRGESAKR